MIERATVQEVPATADMLADAFETDPIAVFYFRGTPAERRPLVREFFEILMSARVALNTPVFLAKLDSRVGGAVMGYDTTRPAWLPEHVSLLSTLETKQSGLAERFNREEEVVKRFKPKHPHYYLGVVGVHGAHQGKGIGAALIERFCAASDADKASTGTYIETANPLNVNFYQRLGFEPTGEADLDAATRLWTLFRPTPSPAP
jgi:ribosomal protein S18 acetylase RimI-like enzyme